MTQPGKTPSDSQVDSYYLLMPDQANAYGTAFGGVIMAWIDMTAAMAAQKHSGTQIVTASIESMSFLEPIRIGEHVHLRARVIYTGHTSMQVEVRVLRENPMKNIKGLATTAYLTFVAIDEENHPVQVAPLLPQTDEERMCYQQAQQRYQSRKK
ncbi:MAG: acyl-CoA thioesterase [Phycisphaerae bacterium]|nr:acyl-CoA thioesterase [Phycisphaerae bacterium]